MTRHCLLLDLIDDADLIAAYRAWHAPGQVPAPVIADIRRRGITAMEIWHVGDRLAMIVETNEDADQVTAPKDGSPDPDVIAWERLMDGFQRRLHFAAADAKWVEAERIFDFADHGPEQNCNTR